MGNKIDLHIHTNASDGTDSPEELLRKIREARIRKFAITDHDTIKGALAMQNIITDDLIFIKGIEFSCRTINNGKCHILGLNYDENNSSFIDALNRGDKLRREKFYKRIEFLHDEFGIKFTDDEIKSLLQIPSVGKPHLGNMIVSKGYAKNRNEAIEDIIDKCKTGNDKIDAELAINAINSSGGISIWAHPLGGERESELPEQKFRETLDELISYGLRGLECFYSKYKLEKCKWLESIARKNGLLISGGSDYHGTNKSIPLGKLNAENIEILEGEITC